MEHTTSFHKERLHVVGGQGRLRQALHATSTLVLTAGIDSRKASQVEEWAALVSRIICVLGN